MAFLTLRLTWSYLSPPQYQDHRLDLSIPAYPSLITYSKISLSPSITNLSLPRNSMSSSAMIQSHSFMSKDKTRRAHFIGVARLTCESSDSVVNLSAIQQHKFRHIFHGDTLKVIARQPFWERLKRFLLKPLKQIPSVEWSCSSAELMNQCRTSESRSSGKDFSQSCSVDLLIADTC